MINVLFTIFISILLFSIEAAETVKSKMMVLAFKNSAGLTKEESASFRRSAIESILLSKRFELFMGQDGLDKLNENKLWYQFEIQIDRVSQYESRITYRLWEKPTNQLISRITEEHIANNRLQYRARVLSLKLIYGKNNVDDQTGNIINAAIVPLDKYLPKEEGEAPADLKTSTLPKQSQFNARKTPIDAVPLDIGVQDALVEKDHSSPAVASETKKNKSDEHNETTELKHRKKGNAEPESFSWNNEADVKISDFASPNLDLEKVPAKNELVSSSQFKTSFNYAIGVEKESIRSNIIFSSKESIALEVGINRLTLKGGLNYDDPDNGHFFLFLAGLSKTIGNNTYAVGPKILMSSQYSYDLYMRKWLAGGLLEFERTGYASVRDRGSGITAVNSNIIWMGIGGTANFEFKDMSMNARLGILKSFYGNTDVGVNGTSVPIEGSRIRLGVGAKVYGKWGVDLNLEKTDINSLAMSTLDNKHFMAAVNVVYN